MEKQVIWHRHIHSSSHASSGWSGWERQHPVPHLSPTSLDLCLLFPEMAASSTMGSHGHVSTCWLSAKELRFLTCAAREDSWETLRQQGYQTSQSHKKSTLNIYWKDWWWSWSSNTLATWCEELTHWERPWCWKIEGRRKKGWQRMGWLDGITDQWTWVSKLWEMVKDREAWYEAVHGVVVRNNSGTEHQHTLDKTSCSWAVLHKRPLIMGSSGSQALHLPTWSSCAHMLGERSQVTSWLPRPAWSTTR